MDICLARVSDVEHLFYHCTAACVVALRTLFSCRAKTAGIGHQDHHAGSVLCPSISVDGEGLPPQQQRDLPTQHGRCQPPSHTRLQELTVEALVSRRRRPYPAPSVDAKP